MSPLPFHWIWKRKGSHRVMLGAEQGSCCRSHTLGAPGSLRTVDVESQSLLLHNSKARMLNYGCRSKHGNSIQASHAIKRCGVCESQRKCSGRREALLFALLLRDSSNIRVVTSNTAKVSQWKFLWCHGQHIKIKKFLKLSAAQRLCMSAFQTLQPSEQLPDG